MTIYIAFNKTGRAFTRTTKRDYEFAIFSGTTCTPAWHNDYKETTVTDTTENMAGRVDLAEKGVESLKKLGYVNAYYAPVEEVQIEKKAAKVWEATADGRTITATTKGALVEMIHYEGAFDRAEEAEVEEAPEQEAEEAEEEEAPEQEAEEAEEEEAPMTLAALGRMGLNCNDPLEHLKVAAGLAEYMENEHGIKPSQLANSMVRMHDLSDDDLLAEGGDTVADFKRAIEESPEVMAALFILYAGSHDMEAFKQEAQDLIEGKRKSDADDEKVEIHASREIETTTAGTVVVSAESFETRGRISSLHVRRRALQSRKQRSRGQGGDTHAQQRRSP